MLKGANRAANTKYMKGIVQISTPRTRIDSTVKDAPTAKKIHEPEQPKIKREDQIKREQDRRREEIDRRVRKTVESKAIRKAS